MDLYIISLPRSMYDDPALNRLRNLVKSKDTILRAALKTHRLQIEVDEEKIYFPWFHITGVDGEAQAYMQLVSSLAETAKKQKYVSDVEKPQDNLKYAMRLSVSDSSETSTNRPEKSCFATYPATAAGRLDTRRKKPKKPNILIRPKKWRYLMIKYRIPDSHLVSQLRERFPKGTRVELISMNDPYNRKLKPGDQGTVNFDLFSLLLSVAAAPVSALSTVRIISGNCKQYHAIFRGQPRLGLAFFKNCERRGRRDCFC